MADGTRISIMTSRFDHSLLYGSEVMWWFTVGASDFRSDGRGSRPCAASVFFSSNKKLHSTSCLSSLSPGRVMDRPQRTDAMFSFPWEMLSFSFMQQTPERTRAVDGPYGSSATLSHPKVVGLKIVTLGVGATNIIGSFDNSTFCFLPPISTQRHYFVRNCSLCPFRIFTSWAVCKLGLLAFLSSIHGPSTKAIKLD